MLLIYANALSIVEIVAILIIYLNVVLFFLISKVGIVSLAKTLVSFNEVKEMTSKVKEGESL